MARAWGQHPADWLGIPETKGCWFWTHWADILLQVEGWYQQQMAERQQQQARSRLQIARR